MKFFTTIAPLLLCLFSPQATLAAPVSSQDSLQTRHFDVSHSTTSAHAIPNNQDLQRRGLKSWLGLTKSKPQALPGFEDLNASTNLNSQTQALKLPPTKNPADFKITVVGKPLQPGIIERIKQKYFNYAQAKYAAGKKPIGHWFLERQAKSGKIWQLKGPDGQIMRLAPFDI